MRPVLALVVLALVLLAFLAAGDWDGGSPFTTNGCDPGEHCERLHLVTPR